jgi:2-dehydropantoate 2-reductase
VAVRIAIFGTGGAGGYFGARLAQAGEDVVFVARGAHLQAIREHGLQVEAADGPFVVRPAGATDDPTRVGPVDAVIVGVKAWQVTDAARAIQPMIGRDTVVVPLQNGVDAPAQLAAVLGPEHVAGGLCGTVSYVAGAGRIRSIGRIHFIRFGEVDGRASDRTRRLREAFVRANVTAEIPADIHAALWEKFLFVVAWGGLGAVTRAPIGVLRQVPETRQMLEQGMREILAVARARRVALTDGIVERTMTFVDAMAPSGTTSLQRDIADGKPSEIEAWSGAVVRLAGEAGVAVPLHTFVYHSLLPLEWQARGDMPFPS